MLDSLSSVNDLELLLSKLKIFNEAGCSPDPDQNLLLYP